MEYMQYYEGGLLATIFVIVLVAFLLYNIWWAQKNPDKLFIRRIPGLNAIDEAIGRATEMGRPVLMVPGLGGLTAVSVQALRIFSHITKTAARFATPIRVCVGNAAVYTVAQEMIGEVYRTEGLMDRFTSESVQFVSDQQFAFATGVSGIIHREKVAAAFLMGEFFAEALIFAETANSLGAIQVACSVQNTQTPFFIAACDYVLISDEFYAASAYLTRQPILIGSIRGQDWVKLAIMGTILLGSVNYSLENTTKITNISTWDAEAKAWKEAPEPFAPRRKSFEETAIGRLFNPRPPIKPEREKEPAPAAAAAPAGGTE